MPITEIENAWVLWTVVLPMLFTLGALWYAWRQWSVNTGYNLVDALFKSLGALVVTLFVWLGWGLLYASQVVVVVGQ